jgi:hypothetical protein
MTRLRPRMAVSPLQGRFATASDVLPTVNDLVAMERPEEPVHCLNVQLPSPRRPVSLSKPSLAR